MSISIETFIRTPVGTEIFFLITSLVVFTMVLWLLSKSEFKEHGILTALRVSIICAGVPFLIRSVSLVFGLSHYQTVTMDGIAFFSEIILLMILIKKIYSLGWGKTVFAWIITYGAKWVVIIIISFAMVMFFTNIFTDIYESRMGGRINISDFNMDGYGEKLGTDIFVVHVNKTVDPISVINITSSIRFLYKTENISIKSLDCYIPHASLFQDVQDEITKYTFKSFNYTGLDLSVWGYAYLACDSACANNKAMMNSGSMQGTEIVSIESGENATMALVFYFEGNDSKTIDCWVDVIAESPESSVKKRFILKYTAD